jgi:hypothetical protein
MAQTFHKAQRTGKARQAALLLCAAALMAMPVAASAFSPRDDQAVAREAANSGSQMSLASIVASVQRQPQFRNLTFLGGAEFNERTKSYRLKFMDGKRVVFVDVDARSGRILGSSR